MTDLAELIWELYQIHPTGGPLHVVLDDGNIDGQITPWYDGWTAEDLDARYYRGWPISELPPEAPAVTEGLGRSTRQLCNEIAAILNAIPEDARQAAITQAARWRP